MLPPAMTARVVARHTVLRDRPRRSRRRLPPDRADEPGMTALGIVAIVLVIVMRIVQPRWSLGRRATVRGRDGRRDLLPDLCLGADVSSAGCRSAAAPRFDRSAGPRDPCAGAVGVLHLRDLRRPRHDANAGERLPPLTRGTVGRAAGTDVQRTGRGGPTHTRIARPDRLPESPRPGRRQQHDRPRALATASSSSARELGPRFTLRPPRELAGIQGRRAQRSHAATARRRSRSSASSTPTTRCIRSGCATRSGTSTIRRSRSCRPRSTIATGRTTPICAASSTASAISSTSR